MRSWKWVLWAAVALFVVSRLAVLMAFPIFNDEGIYLQYAQLVHHDFGKYQFVSEGGLYADWKPPLQYWIGAPFVGATPNDPLLGGRLAVFFVSAFGLWGLYLFIRKLFGEKEAALAVALYALCPPALFYNVQFIAETFVISLAPWVYWSFLKATAGERLRPWYVAAAAGFGMLLLLSKQSGMVYLMLSFLLPLALFAKHQHKNGSKQWDWKKFWVRAALVAGGVLFAYLLSRLGASAQSAKLEGRFNSNWLMSVGDLLKFPIATWGNNWTVIRDYYYSYYSVFILAPIAYFLWIAYRRARRGELKDAAVALGFLAASGAILILLKGFNEYIYNTAVVVFLVALLARAALAAWEARRTPLGMVVLAAFALMLLHWTYQDVLMRVSPAKYIERGTPWMVEGYLENWSGGFGVKEAIAAVKAQAGNGPGLIIADPQWGNPRTALEVYNQLYPDFRVVGLTTDFQTDAGSQAVRTYIDQQAFKTRLAIYSAAANSTREVWQAQIQKYFCTSKQVIQVVPQQPPIIICTF